VAKKKQRVTKTVKIVDLSGDEPGSVDNVDFRALVQGFDAEVERLHAKLRDLESQYEVSQRRNRVLHAALRRYKWVSGTVFIGGGTKAIYEMAISPWASEHWWINAGLAAGMISAMGYLIAPNIRKLWRLSGTD
jgi:hypothetical protein